MDYVDPVASTSAYGDPRNAVLEFAASTDRAMPPQLGPRPLPLPETARRTFPWWVVAAIVALVFVFSSSDR